MYLHIFFSTPGLREYNFETHEGGRFNYYSSGAAVSEVEIDCLTGDHSVSALKHSFVWGSSSAKLQFIFHLIFSFISLLKRAFSFT